jgi:hypothetical protein
VAVLTTIEALSRGARATGRSAWLVAPALVVAFLRAALAWPAPLFALAMARAGVASRLAAGAEAPSALLDGAVLALTAPRTLYTLAGLFLAGVAASGVLRVAFLAGALPTLGERLAGSELPRPRFAEGLAFGFQRLFGTALLGFVLELAAEACLVGAVLSTVAIALHRPGGLGAIFPALLAASVLTLGLAMLLVAGVSADAALARTSLLGERPVRALAEGLARVLARPGAFALAAFSLAAAGAVVVGSVKAFEAAALGTAQGAPILLVLGPRVMAMTLGAGLSALLELWRLASIAALACGEDGSDSLSG